MRTLKNDDTFVGTHCQLNKTVAIPFTDIGTGREIDIYDSLESYVEEGGTTVFSAWVTVDDKVAVQIDGTLYDFDHCSSEDGLTDWADAQSGDDCVAMTTLVKAVNFEKEVRSDDFWDKIMDRGIGGVYTAAYLYRVEIDPEFEGYGLLDYTLRHLDEFLEMHCHSTVRFATFIKGEDEDDLVDYFYKASYSKASDCVFFKKF